MHKMNYVTENRFFTKKIPFPQNQNSFELCYINNQIKNKK